MVKKITQLEWPKYEKMKIQNEISETIDKLSRICNHAPTYYKCPFLNTMDILEHVAYKEWILPNLYF